MKATSNHDIVLYFEKEIGNVSTDRIFRSSRVRGILEFPSIGKLHNEPLSRFAVHPYPSR